MFLFFFSAQALSFSFFEGGGGISYWRSLDLELDYKCTSVIALVTAVRKLFPGSFALNIFQKMVKCQFVKISKPCIGNSLKTGS